MNKDISIKTSKHIGIISIFDKEFVHTGKFDRYYSKILHKMFDARQESDYKELVEVSKDEIKEYMKYGREFLNAIKEFIKKSSICKQDG